MTNKVSIGSTSIIGWSSAVLALIPTVIKAVETGSTALAGPEKYLAVAGIAVGLVTQVGRYLQAHKLISSQITSDISGVVNKLDSAVSEPGKNAEIVDVSDLPTAPKPVEAIKDNSVLAGA